MEHYINLLVSEPVKEIADQLWTGLIFFTVWILAVGIAIAVWRIVVFFNRSGFFKIEYLSIHFYT